MAETICPELPGWVRVVGSVAFESCEGGQPWEQANLRNDRNIRGEAVEVYAHT